MPDLIDILPRALGVVGLLALAGFVYYGARSPIFWIDLVTTARRMRYLAIRVIYASILLFVLYTSYESTLGSRYYDDYGSSMQITLEGSARFAQAFFQQFAWVQLMAVTLLTPAFVAGIIATEREGKTIEYLFTTDLSDAEIVLGKLATRVAHLLSILLVALPILALSTLFGGLSADRILQSFALSGSMLCSTAGLSLAMSIRARRARDAVIGTYLVLLGVLVLPALLFAIARLVTDKMGIDLFETMFRLSLTAHPFVVLFDDLRMTMTGISGDWTSLVVLMGWHATFTSVLVGVSVYGVRRVQVREASAGVRPKRGRLQWLRPEIGEHPMLWKELFAETWRIGLAGYIAVSLIMGAVCVPLGFAFVDSLRAYASGREFAGVCAGVSIYLMCGTILIASARAAMSVSSEHERDTWLSLISTPITGQEVVLAKVAGAMYSVRFPVLFIAAIWFLATLRRPEAFAAMLAHAFTSLVVALFCTNLGVMFSLSSKSSMRAMGGTLGIVIFLGGFYLCCCTPVMFAGGPGRGGEIILAPCLSFLIGASAFLTEFSHTDEMLAPYVFGVGMYLVATVALFAMNVSTFERLSGRTIQR